MADGVKVVYRSGQVEIRTTGQTIRQALERMLPYLAGSPEWVLPKLDVLEQELTLNSCYVDPEFGGHRWTARRGARREIDPDLLRYAAAVYRDNDGQAPVKAVAAAIGVGERMAANYVRKARDQGFLALSAKELRR